MNPDVICNGLAQLRFDEEWPRCNQARRPTPAPGPIATRLDDKRRGATGLKRRCEPFGAHHVMREAHVDSLILCIDDKHCVAADELPAGANEP